MNVNPITPKEAEGSREFPDEVIESFNEIIIEHFNNGRAKFKQAEVVARIVAKTQLPTCNEIYDERWLDVEDVYRKNGWKVTYDKPAYNETYDATFLFEKAKE